MPEEYMAFQGQSTKQEPAESAPELAIKPLVISRNLRPLGRGGCQPKRAIILVLESREDTIGLNFVLKKRG